MLGNTDVYFAQALRGMGGIPSPTKKGSYLYF